MMQAMMSPRMLMIPLVCVLGAPLLGGPPLMEIITFQGQLKKGGVPATGEFDFQFKLFDAYSMGSQVSVTIPRSNIDVTNGLFSVGLDWPADVFDGTDLWIQVEVRPGDSAGSFTALAPRQAMTGVAYAIHARSAALLTLPFAGSVSIAGDAFSITNEGGGVAGTFTVDSPTGRAPAVWVDTNSEHQAVAARTTGTGSAGRFAIDNPANNSPALIGKSDGGGIAVYGEQLGSGRAGFFLNNAATNDSDALEAKTQGTGRAGHFHIVNTSNPSPALRASTNGTGPALQVLANGSGRGGDFNVTDADNTNAAVFGWTQGRTGKAVQGWASATGSTTNYGGFFVADGDRSRGVYATSNGPFGRGLVGESNAAGGVGTHGTSEAGTGVFGEATGTSGVNYGVRGSSSSPNGYAGHFEGRGYFAGRVGLGTTTPDQQLHVVGNAKVTGWIGTDEDQEVTFRTNDRIALRLAPAASDSTGFAPNVIGGHSANYVAADRVGAFIGGGGYSDPIPQIGERPNRVIGDFGAIGGGYNNEAGLGSFVGGGIGNVAGNDNLAQGPFAQWAVVAGGQGNDAMNFCATVGGGVHNEANGDESTVAGGSSNIAGDAEDPPFENIGRWASVGGGNNNNARASGSTIPGGGYAEARMPYQFAYAAGGFRAERGSAQTSTYVVRYLSYSRGPHRMSDGSAPLIVYDGKTWAFDILIAARAKDGTSAAYQIVGAIKRAGPTTTFIGTPSVKTIGEDGGASSLGVGVLIEDFFPDHRLEISVTGADDTEIRWVATVRTTEVAWTP